MRNVQNEGTTGFWSRSEPTDPRTTRSRAHKGRGVQRPEGFKERDAGYFQEGRRKEGREIERKWGLSNLEPETKADVHGEKKRKVD